MAHKTRVSKKTHKDHATLSTAPSRSSPVASTVPSRVTSAVPSRIHSAVPSAASSAASSPAPTRSPSPVDDASDNAAGSDGSLSGDDDPEKMLGTYLAAASSNAL